MHIRSEMPENDPHDSVATEAVASGDTQGTTPTAYEPPRLLRRVPLIANTHGQPPGNASGVETVFPE